VTGMKEFSSYYIAKYYNQLSPNSFSDWRLNSSMKEKYDENPNNSQELPPQSPSNRPNTTKNETTKF
jgi:hypothetical protein